MGVVYERASLLIGPVVAHAGGVVGPDEAWAAWRLDWLVIAGLVLSGYLYRRGAHRLRSSQPGRRAVPRWRVGCFWAALVTVAVAILSPVEGIAGSLFSAHMVQHQLLVLIAAPLLVVARPLVVTSAALDPPWRDRLNSARRALTPPRGAPHWAFALAGAHTAVWYAWHIPALYELALRSQAAHAFEHVTLLVSGVGLWWIVADPRGRYANPVGILAIFAATLTSAWLAGLLSFTGRPWYPAHAAGAAAWGLTASQDQEFAAGLMWFPGAPAYIAAGWALFLRYLRRDESAAEMTTGYTARVGQGPPVHGPGQALPPRSGARRRAHTPEAES